MFEIIWKQPSHEVSRSVKDFIQNSLVSLIKLLEVEGIKHKEIKTVLLRNLLGFITATNKDLDENLKSEFFSQNMSHEDLLIYSSYVPLFKL